MAALRLVFMSDRISVINTRHTQLDSLVYEADIVDFNMKKAWSRTDTINIGADKYTELFTIPKGLNLTQVYFVKLSLLRKNGMELSENTYWLSSSEKPDYTTLANLEPVAVDISGYKVEKGKECPAYILGFELPDSVSRGRKDCCCHN